MHQRNNHSIQQNQLIQHRHIPSDAGYASWQDVHDLFIHDLFMRDLFMRDLFTEENDPMQVQLSTFAPSMPFPLQPALPGVSSGTSSHQPSARHHRVARGHVLFDVDMAATSTFQLVEGEIVIMRRGLAIDLVEAGEYVDVSMWSGNTTAVARTDCTLSV